MRLVVGIPTVRRSHDYLLQTVSSLFGGIAPEDRCDVEVVVLNAERPPVRHKAVAMLRERHRDLIAAGALTILDCASPNIEELGRLPPLREGIPRERALWEAQINLDAAFLMRACATRGTHYLRLEDDVVAAPDFWPRFRSWYDRYFASRDDWLILSLYTHWRDSPDPRPPPVPIKSDGHTAGDYCGSIGHLIQARDLEAVSDYVELGCFAFPLDWLLHDYLSEIGRPGYVHLPPLFQHVGVISSHPGVVQLADSLTFEEPAKARMRRLTAELAAALRHRPAHVLAVLRFRLRRERRRWREMRLSA